jgi:hypothetical protein
VRSAGGREDLAQQPPQALGVDAVDRVVGPDELRGTLHAGPLPTGPDHDGGAGLLA